MPAFDAMPDALARLRGQRLTPGDHGLARHPPGTSVGPRRMTGWQFVWLVRGDATWVVEGRELPVPEGAVMRLADAVTWERRRHPACGKGGISPAG